MTNFLFLIVSLIGLWFGTTLIVKASISLAKKYQIRETFIGLSVLAFGTDLPELAIMLDASLFPLYEGAEASIILGSALGSAIGQISFVLGTISLIGAPFLLRKDVFRHGGILCFSIFILFVFSFDGMISRIEGLVLTALYAGYFILLLKLKSFSKNRPEPEKIKSSLKAWTMIAVGFILLLGNAKLAVIATLAMADEFSLSSSSVAVVIIGLGSSLPELSLSAIALAKRKVGLSLGNLVGSNVLDTLLIPGIGAAIRPLAADKDIVRFDIPFLLIVTLLALYFLYVSPKGIKRSYAIMLLIGYSTYIAVRFGRELF